MNYLKNKNPHFKMDLKPQLKAESIRGDLKLHIIR